jgi:hypothetical protein
LADAQHLPHGRRQAGDRHLNFHEPRDNLCDLAKALRSFKSPPVAVGSVSGNMLRKLCSREGIVMGVAAGARGDHFWDGFLWGAATAAHQVEGGSVNSDGSACGAPAARMG